MAASRLARALLGTARSLTAWTTPAALLEQNRAFGEVIRSGDPSTPVPTCPGWSLSQLFRHVGRGDRWAAQIVADRVDHYLDPRTVDEGKPPADPDEAISWLHGGAQRLIDAVEQVGVETPVWTFLGSRPAYWWVRRRLHEATVHRADAALALRLDYALTPELAADAIAEWLERVAAAGRTRRRTAAAGRRPNRASARHRSWSGGCR